MDSSLGDWPLCFHASALTRLFSPPLCTPEPSSITKLFSSPSDPKTIVGSSTWPEAEGERSPSYMQVEAIRECVSAGSFSLQLKRQKAQPQTQNKWDRCRHIKRKTIVSQKTCSCNLHSTGRRANPVEFPP